MFFAVLKKEFLTELRSKEVLSILISFQLLLALIAALSLESSYLDNASVARLFPAFFYLIVVVTAALGLSRNSESEFESAAILGVATAVPDISKYYLAKALFGALLLLLCSALGGLFLTVLLNTPAIHLWAVIKPLPILCIGLSGILTLLSPLSFTSRLKGLILPVLALPCCIPLFLLSIEESYRTIAKSPTAGELLLPLALFAALYTLLGTRLFRPAVIG